MLSQEGLQTMNVKQIMYLLYWKTVISQRDVSVAQNGWDPFLVISRLTRCT